MPSQKKVSCDRYLRLRSRWTARVFAPRMKRSGRKQVKVGCRDGQRSITVRFWWNYSLSDALLPA